MTVLVLQTFAVQCPATCSGADQEATPHRGPCNTSRRATQLAAHERQPFIIENQLLAPDFRGIGTLRA